MTPPELLTKSEYAKHRGVGPSMVTKWVQAGRLVLRGGKVDVAASDAALAAVQDKARGGKGGGPSAVAAAPVAAVAPGSGAGPADPPPPGVAPLVAATTADKLASAELKRARVDRELGRLVDRGAFEDAAADAFAVVRHGLLNFAARVAPVLADKLGVDPRRATPILEAEARRLANELADAVAGMTDQVGETRQ